MDKDLLRIIIIAIGLVIIIAMFGWGYWRNLQARAAMNSFDDDDNEPEAFTSGKSADFGAYEFDESMSRNLGNSKALQDDFADDEAPEIIEPRFQSVEKAMFQSEEHVAPVAYEHAATASSYSKPQPAPVAEAPKTKLPAVVQFSIAAKNPEGFNGLDLLEVFDMVGLEYGSMKIFERLDFNRLVDFGVAGMVNPGTFPINDMASFYTPGITFFMQPSALPDPVLVFDDMVRTINLIAKELDGIKLDGERKPLSEFTLKDMRKSLQP